MSYQVRYTEGAKSDLVQLYKFLLDMDIEAARRAISAIKKNLELLENFPFSCRKAAKPQSRKAAKPQSRKAAKPQSRRG